MEDRRMKTVALVPIKLNSQRLPHKNILPLAGHPLCWHILNTLTQIKDIDEVYVYCSDEEVTKYIPQGAKFLKRDARLHNRRIGFNPYIQEVSSIEAIDIDEQKDFDLAVEMTKIYPLEK